MLIFFSFSPFRNNILRISQNTVKCVQPILPELQSAARKVIVCAEVWKNYAYVYAKMPKSRSAKKKHEK